MATAKRPLFREAALKQYLKQREQDIIPQRMRSTLFLYTWIILAIFLLLGIIIWSIAVPRFLSFSGIITEGRNSTNGPVLVFFLPSHLARQVQPGAQVRINGTMNSTILTVGKELLSPREIRQRYHLDAGEGALITEPAFVAEARFPLKDQRYLGSAVTVQVQVGTQRLLTLFLG